MKSGGKTSVPAAAIPMTKSAAYLTVDGWFVESRKPVHWYRYFIDDQASCSAGMFRRWFRGHRWVSYPPLHLPDRIRFLTRFSAGIECVSFPPDPPPSVAHISQDISVTMTWHFNNWFFFVVLFSSSCVCVDDSNKIYLLCVWHSKYLSRRYFLIRRKKRRGKRGFSVMPVNARYWSEAIRQHLWYWIDDFSYATTSWINGDIASMINDDFEIWLGCFVWAIVVLMGDSGRYLVNRMALDRRHPHAELFVEKRKWWNN